MSLQTHTLLPQAKRQQEFWRDNMKEISIKIDTHKGFVFVVFCILCLLDFSKIVWYVWAESIGLVHVLFQRHQFHLQIWKRKLVAIWNAILHLPHKCFINSFLEHRIEENTSQECFKSRTFLLSLSHSVSLSVYHWLKQWIQFRYFGWCFFCFHSYLILVRIVAFIKNEKENKEISFSMKASLLEVCWCSDDWCRMRMSYINGSQ